MNIVLKIEVGESPYRPLFSRYRVGAPVQNLGFATFDCTTLCQGVKYGKMKRYIRMKCFSRYIYIFSILVSNCHSFSKVSLSVQSDQEVLKSFSGAFT